MIRVAPGRGGNVFGRRQRPAQRRRGSEQQLLRKTPEPPLQGNHHVERTLIARDDDVRTHDREREPPDAACVARPGSAPSAAAAGNANPNRASRQGSRSDRTARRLRRQPFAARAEFCRYCSCCKQTPEFAAASTPRSHAYSRMAFGPTFPGSPSLSANRTGPWPGIAGGMVSRTLGRASWRSR